MNEFDHVYVGYFFDQDQEETFCERTYNYKLADHWKSLPSHVATEVVAFRIPEEALAQGFEGSGPPTSFGDGIDPEVAPSADW